MHKMVVLAAVVAALAMASQPVEARHRGFGSRHFSTHSGPKLHLRQHGLKFHHGGVFGKRPPFKSRHFGQGGLVLKFGDGDAVLKFGHVLTLKPRRFGHGHGQSGLCFRFDRSRHMSQQHDRGFAFKDPHSVHLRHFPRQHPAFRGGQGVGLHGGVPPEALLRQLEQLGFRHVPELLRESSR